MENDEMPGTVSIKMATDKQVKYIKDLAEKRQMAPETKERLLTKLPEFSSGKASETIGWLLRQPVIQKPGKWEVPDSIPDGRYAIIVDGVWRFFRIVTSKSNGKRYVQKVLGNPGSFRYDRVTTTEWIAAVNGITTDPQKWSMAFGMQVGACGVCGSPLTDPESIRLGIGPICRAKWNEGFE
jgi:hypothetical protein